MSGTSLTLARAPEASFAKWWLLFFGSVALLIAILIVISARMPAIQLFEIPSTAMEPTIVRGDRIIAEMHYYRARKPKDGDVILYKRRNIIFVKRVIASPHETVKGSDDGGVYVNGRLIGEPYVQHTRSPHDWLTEFGPVSVPADNYFVMGDNRDVSLDSRSPGYGFVTGDSIVGRATRVLFNPRAGRFGKRIQ